MQLWFVLSSLALIFWGLWGFFSKLTTVYLNPRSAFLYELLGSLIIGLVVLLIGFRPEVHPRGIALGIVTGLMLGLGHLLFFLAASKGKISLVVMMTALYPAITILLAFVILQEAITLKQGLGMLFTVAAILLFAA